MYRLHDCDIFSHTETTLFPFVPVDRRVGAQISAAKVVLREHSLLQWSATGARGHHRKTGPCCHFFSSSVSFRQLRIKQIAGSTHVHPELTAEMQMRRAKKELLFQC
ncbi:hypothetical protein CDAR_429971 [Caerostris darwini]|uniref:Uncharacterized protein n=1 Tax=Caerostris darwini TaxID=1538125 RepID=A0AAV4RRT9_9ARAC|nr:hypothetical protein CDAR_429971 [Caerostris darwini]